MTTEDVNVIKITRKDYLEKLQKALDESNENAFGQHLKAYIKQYYSIEDVAKELQMTPELLDIVFTAGEQSSFIFDADSLFKLLELVNIEITMKMKFNKVNILPLS